MVKKDMRAKSKQTALFLWAIGWSACSCPFRLGFSWLRETDTGKEKWGPMIGYSILFAIVWLSIRLLFFVLASLTSH